MKMQETGQEKTAPATTRRVILGGALALSVCVAEGRARGADPGKAPGDEKAKTPKYYFNVTEITGDVDDETKQLAGELLVKELLSRPEFTTELGEGVSTDPAVAAPELKKRGLRGFDISLKFEEFKKELRDPRPGARLKQLALSVRVSLFGAEIPGKKIAFSGQGESMQIAEVFENKLDKETRTLMVEVLADAIRQAADQAVVKLALPRNLPLNEDKDRSGKKRGQGGGR